MCKSLPHVLRTIECFQFMATTTISQDFVEACNFRSCNIHMSYSDEHPRSLPHGANYLLTYERGFARATLSSHDTSLVCDCYSSHCDCSLGNSPNGESVVANSEPEALIHRNILDCKFVDFGSTSRISSLSEQGLKVISPRNNIIDDLLGCRSA